MSEDNVYIQTSYFAGYIKLYKDIYIPRDLKFNRDDVIGNQSGIERRFFSGYFLFTDESQEKIFYMRSYLLTLDENIPGNEYIHSLIQLFAYTESQNYFLNNISFDLKSGGTILNGLKENIGEFYLDSKVGEEIFFDGREEIYLKYLGKSK